MNCKKARYDINVASTSTNEIERFKVVLITMDKIDEYWNYVDQGAADMAAMAGIDYIWEAPDIKNNERQVEILKNAVENGADLILLAANDPVAISRAIEDAKSKNVKIIYVDSPAYEEAIITLSTDNYAAGRTAALIMLNELEAAGINNGSIGIIGVNMRINSTLNREAGFRDVLAEDGRFIVIPTAYREGDPAMSQEAAEGFIIDNPDLVGIFGANEGSTVGLGNAIKTYNNKIIGIGFDRSVPIEELLNEGSLKAVIVQNPYTMGYLGMAEAIAALKGYDTGPDEINTGVAILT